MAGNRMRRLGLLAAALLASAQLATAAESGLALPTYTPGYEPATVDERGMWMEADERERMLRDSPLRINDGKLEPYVRAVLCREVGTERCQGVRVYVMEIPAFNATMMPNGCMEVWSGLLLRARSEAELAAVLGHEFGHFELRHSLMGFKNRRGSSDVAAWIGVLGGLSNVNTGSLQATIVASTHRFDRDQETSADLLGMKYMATSGYPSKASAAVWRQLMAEQDATATGRGLKLKQQYTAGTFATHPTNLARATYLAAQAEKTPGGTDDRAAEYRAAIAPYLPRLLAAQNKMNDFGGSDFIMAAIAERTGWTGDLLFARAELYRARGNPRDLQMASTWYREAKMAGYAAPDLDRNLGLALLRNGQAEEGRQALAAYLAANPAASDATMIQTLMAN
ncbi:M48 family metallopeptidase [Sphingomonas sp. ID0503]|uniref:M48 family metallopeptidase n=1 Tax=Sphingomonas sp. ID0503 TaxID=3399691 RepID=UPI003AFA2678